MKRVDTSKLVPGMIIAEDVYNYSNQLILPKGLILNDKTITKLAFYSIIQVKVENQLATVSDTFTLDMPSHADKIKSSPEFAHFRQKFEKDVNVFKNAVNAIVTEGTDLDIDKLLDQTLSILHVGQSTANLFDMLHCMRDYDDGTYVHSMNVALICNVFARWLRMNEEEIRLATISGLLHDVGKTKIPSKIIKKPGKLTSEEYDIVKTHPEEGYRLMQHCKLHPDVLNAILMHHERCDGSGYPYGVDGSKMSNYAKIVSIADVYDAMTSARIYRGPLCPFKAIALFESEGLQKYDAHYILTFLENVVNTYLLNRARLSNGMVGDIIYINKDKLSAPTVKTEYGFFDLSTQPDITIEALI